MAQFDIEGARRAGWNNAEIVRYLADQNPSFDVQGAREAGYDDAEIGQFLATGEGFSRSAFGAVGAIPRGANTGLANVMGAPVDMINAGLGAIGVPVSDEPFGGSASIRSGIDALAGNISRAFGGAGTRATYDDINDLPPSERMGAVAGEVIGGSIPFAAAPMALAALPAQTTRTATPLVSALTNNPITNTARSAPGMVAAGEIGGIAGAAQGAALAEMIAPGDELARFGGEVAGGLANPAGLMARAAGGASQAARNFVSGFTRSGQDRRAAEYVAQAFQATGEDPSQVLTALRAAQEIGAPTTVGQMTGSPTVLAIESQLGRANPQFANNRNVMAQEGLEALRSSVDQIASIGTPEALVQAARLRGRYFDELMNTRLSLAEEEARSALQQMAPDGTSVRPEASARAYEALDTAILDARRIETELWGEVPRNIPISGNGLMASNHTARSMILPDARLDPAVEGMIRRVSDGQPFTSAEFLTLRSDLLNRARMERSGMNPDYRMAEVYDELARGVLRDLSEIPGPEAEIARQFSGSMHDAFSRTFAGQALGNTSTGGSRIEPEMMLERAFGGGGTQADIRLQQLQAAAEFPGTGRGMPMAQAQEDFLRGTAARAINPETGLANAAQLARFAAASDGVMGRFPAVQSDIASAIASQRALENVARRPQFAQSVLGNSSPLGQLLRGETPTTAVRTALNQGDTAYAGLANMAANAGPEAIEGLQSATLNHMMREATRPDGTFDFSVFRQKLSNPSARGEAAPIDLMVRNGVMTDDQVERLNVLMDRADAIQSSLSRGREFDELVGSPDAITDLVLRLVGARMGAQSPIAQGSGASLVMAGAASRTMRNMFGSAPKARIEEALIRMVQDPELFAMALERAPTPQMRADINARIHASLVNAGVNLDHEDADQSPLGNAIGQSLWGTDQRDIPSITVNYSPSELSGVEGALMETGMRPPIPPNPLEQALLVAGR